MSGKPEGTSPPRTTAAERDQTVVLAEGEHDVLMTCFLSVLDVALSFLDLAVFLKCTEPYPTRRPAPTMPMLMPAVRHGCSATQSADVSHSDLGGGGGGGGGGTSNVPSPGMWMSWREGRDWGPNRRTSSQRRWMASLTRGMSGVAADSDEKMSSSRDSR